ncbi:MAG: galactose-1-phosphate uridylyltransferase [Micromonosporaceae bacterium]|nr:galactose-1-phosphate uridylyltransferase [Micromonosporaceae bacterium]
MKRTLISLADGRDLIYYDESDDSDRSAVDKRDLPPPPPASEIRYDPVLDEWVAVAAHRQERTFLPPQNECPLCPSRPGHLTEIPADSYHVAVFENRFPSFSDRLTGEIADADGILAGARHGFGRCEVVCFTADHDSTFGALTPSRVRTVMEAWADRTADLSALPGVEQVFCFENRGEEIGVTLHHPHGQIYAYPFITPRTRRMLGSARRHAEDAGGNLFADLLAAERSVGDRVVVSNEHWTGYVPRAARWPFEVHIFPHRRVPDLPALTDAERDAFGPLYLDLLRRLDGLFGTPMPYIAAWHQAPVRADRDLAYLHLQLFSIRRAPGKLKYLAGSESAMGVFVNDLRPEDAARMLRESGS